MIDVSEQYQKAVVGSSRVIKAKVKFNGVTLLDDDKVISVSLNEIANSNEKLTIGELNSAKATVQFVMPDSKIPLKNGSFSIQSGLMVNGKYEYVDKGTFYIDTIESGMGSKVVTVSGYDSIYRMNVEYEPSIEYPATLENVINDICNQCNITHDISDIPSMTLEGYQENITCKTFMGYCLGLMGMNGRMNESDKLVGYWFEESGFKVTWDNQFQEGFKLTSDEDIKITSVTCNGLSCGSGYGILFENPYMTQELLDTIYKKVNGLVYSPSTVEWRGNPALQISDIIKVEDNKGMFHNVILSEHTITLTGMRDTVTCKGSTDELAMNTSNSPTQLLIKRLYNTLTNAFKNNTENILGHNGGHFVIDVNDEGFPSGWSIMDTPTLRDDTKMWKFTSGGLGYSADGGKTFTKIAFDLDGNFSANTITTGVINGEMFELNLETGVIKIGKRDSDGEISNPSFYLNEKGELTIKVFDELEKKVNEGIITVSLLPSATILNSENESITITCQVMSGKEDITQNQNDLAFQWYLDSTQFKKGKTLTLTSDDIGMSVNVKCIVTIDNIQFDTGYTTIVDESDTVHLGNSYLDVTNTTLTQKLNDNGTYMPDWTITPAIITPCIMNNNVIIELSDCTIGYKKIINSKEVDIDSSYEIIKDSILTINKNVMNKNTSNVTYICDVTYKNTSIRLYVGFSLTEQGVGIKNITTYYLASSKSENVRVDSEGWTTSIQTINANNKYLWTYSVTSYTDGTSKTSEPLIMGSYGDDAITLYIESSNGNTFKNSDIATILTVHIYVGAERIESAEQLEKRFGKNAYLQWSVKKFGEEEFSPIDSEDARMNDKGFIFTISPKDINKKAVFNCELIMEE